MNLQFQQKLQEFHDNKCKDNFTQQLREDLENFNVDENLKQFSHNKNFNIKRVICRSVTLFVSALGRLHGLRENSSFAIVDALQRSNKISKNAAHRLTQAVAVACHIRLVYYTTQNRQDDKIDNIYKENERMGGREKLKELVKIVDYKDLVKCLVTAYILQEIFIFKSDISEFDQFLEKDEDIYQLKILNTLGLLHESISAGELYFKSHAVHDQSTCHVLLHLQNAYMLNGQFEKSLQLSEKTLALLPSVPEYEYFHAVSTIFEAACLHYLDKSLLSANKSDALLKTNLTPNNRFECLHVNSLSKYALMQYHEALSACRDARKMFVQMKFGLNSTLHAGAYQISALALAEIGRKDQAVQWAREGLNLMIKIKATENYVRGFKQIIRYITHYDTYSLAYRNLKPVSTFRTPLDYILEFV